MSWDFETDPEFQAELDWVDDFVRDEVEPVDQVDPPRLGHGRPGAPGADPAAAGPGPRAGPVGGPPRPAPRRAGLRPGEAGAAQRDPRSLAQRADRLRLPGTRFRQRRDPRPLRHRRAEEALPRAAAAQRGGVGVLDDRAARRLRPDRVRHARRARRRRVGHQRREVVLVARQLRLVPDRPGRHRARRGASPADVDVRRAPRHAGRRDPAQRRDLRPPRGAGHAQLRPLHRRADPRRPPARRPRRGLRRRPDQARRRPYPPRHAHRRARQVGARPDVRAGAVADDPGRDRWPASSSCRR